MVSLCMRLVNKNSDVAIRSLGVLAKYNRSMSITEISRELKLSRPFLRKIMQILAGAGLLTSVRGKGGGFSLTKEPGKIPLNEVLEIFQGPFRMGSCNDLHGNVCMEMKDCRLRRKLCSIEEYAKKELASFTILDLVE